MPLPHGGYVVPIDTLTNLAALPASSLIDGTHIYCNEVEDIYVLEKAGSHSADGLCVISATGGGYWVARNAGRWDDVLGSISQGTAGAALTYEVYRDTAFMMYFMRHDQDDALSFVFQFPHTWKYNTNVKPHLHVIPMADPSSSEDVYFTGYYAWTKAGGAALPALSSWTTFTKTQAIAPGDIYIQKLVSLVTITPPSEARGSTCLMLYVRRNGTSPNDTYTTSKSSGTSQANLGLVSADVHFQRINAGSEAETPT